MELKTALAYMEEQQMLPAPGELLLAAVSGGRDSMVLLDFLVKLGRERGFFVAAAHFNHHLRPAADADEAFVRAWTTEQNIPFYSDGADVAAFCRENSLSIEEGARQARYTWLERLCREMGAVAVATAHHLSDQAETVLLNLTRGTGMEGLRGIAPRWGVFLRPLLTISRAEIDGYAACYGISHVEDESNADLRFSRNRLRAQVMPLLQEINPQVEAALARTASVLAEEDAWLEREVKRCLPEIVALRDGVAVDYAAFCALDAALRPRAVRQLLGHLEAGRKDITAGQLRAAACLTKGRSLTLPGHILISVERGLFRVEKRGEQPKDVSLPLNGEVCWGGWRITCRTTDEKVKPNGNTLVFSLDKIETPVTVSSWKQEGRLTMEKGSRSLKRLFADAGISVRERENVPVLYCGGTAIAAIGVAADLSYTGENGPWWVVGAVDKKE